MNRRTDTCPNACTVHGRLAVAIPATWTQTSTGAIGTYLCPVCGRRWSTSFRAELDAVSWP